MPTARSCSGFSGTGKIIHGHVPGAGDSAHGGKAAIKTAGVQRVERGLDRIEGKLTDTSAAGHDPARDQERRMESVTALAPTTTLQATSAALRADPTSQKARRGQQTSGILRTGARAPQQLVLVAVDPCQNNATTSELTQAAATT